MKETQRLWQSATNLFHYRKIEKTMEDELPNADLRLAVMVIVAAGILSSMISILINLESIHLINFTYEVASEITAEPAPQISFDQLVPFALFQLLFNVPFIVLFTLVYEGIMFKILKALKGKATFMQQFYLSSIVMFAVALSSGVGLLLPLPCLQLLGIVAMIVLTVYFSLYVSARAYQVAHRIPFVHSFIVVALLLLPRFILMSVVVNAAAVFFGLPEAYSGV